MSERAWQPSFWPYLSFGEPDPWACVRCGRTKDDERYDPGSCYNWGVWYEGHLMPREDGSLELWSAQYDEALEAKP